MQDRPSARRNRDLSRALRRVRLWCGNERQTGQHDRIREALEPAARALARGVREPAQRRHPVPASRDAKHPSLQPGPLMMGRPVRLGLGPNLAQFSLLVVVNAFVGAMVGLERTILPAIAEKEFKLVAHAAVLSFIVVFGVTKALTNYFAGRLSDRVGRKRVLVGGWLVALPVPFLLIWAPSWSWVLAANALLGVSQGLTWSTTVIMKIDLSGPRQRGLAMGLNEAAGYVALAAAALA